MPLPTALLRLPVGGHARGWATSCRGIIGGDTLWHSVHVRSSLPPAGPNPSDRRWAHQSSAVMQQSVSGAGDASALGAGRREVSPAAVHAAVAASVRSGKLNDAVGLIESVFAAGAPSTVAWGPEALHACMRAAAASGDLPCADRLVGVMMAEPESRLDGKSVSTYLSLLASLPALDHERGLSFCALLEPLVPGTYEVYIQALASSGLSTADGERAARVGAERLTSLLDAMRERGEGVEAYVFVLRGLTRTSALPLLLDRVVGEAGTALAARAEGGGEDATTAPAAASSLQEAFTLGLLSTGRVRGAVDLVRVGAGLPPTWPPTLHTPPTLASLAAVLDEVLQPLANEGSMKLGAGSKEVVDSARADLLCGLLASPSSRSSWPRVLNARRSDTVVRALKRTGRLQELTAFITDTVAVELRERPDRVARWRVARAADSAGPPSDDTTPPPPLDADETSADVKWSSLITRTTLHRAMNDLATERRRGELEGVFRLLESLPPSADADVPVGWRLRPSDITYSIMLRHYALDGEAERVRALWLRMKELSFHPTMAARMAVAELQKKLAVSGGGQGVLSDIVHEGTERMGSSGGEEHIKGMDQLMDRLLEEISVRFVKRAQSARSSFDRTFLRQEAQRLMGPANRTVQEYFVRGRPVKAVTALLKCEAVYSQLTARPDTVRLTTMGLLLSGGPTVSGWRPESVDVRWGGTAEPGRAVRPTDHKLFGEEFKSKLRVKSANAKDVVNTDLRVAWRVLTGVIAADMAASRTGGGGGGGGSPPALLSAKAVADTALSMGLGESAPCHASLASLVKSFRSFSPRVSGQPVDEGEVDPSDLTSAEEDVGQFADKDLLGLVQYFYARAFQSLSSKSVENASARAELVTSACHVVRSSFDVVPIQRSLQLFLNIYAAGGFQAWLTESPYTGMLLPNVRVLDARAPREDMSALFAAVCLGHLAHSFCLGLPHSGLVIDPLTRAVTPKGLFFVTGNSWNYAGSRLGHFLEGEMPGSRLSATLAHRGYLLTPPALGAWLQDFKSRAELAVQRRDIAVACSQKAYLAAKGGGAPAERSAVGERSASPPVGGPPRAAAPPRPTPASPPVLAHKRGVGDLLKSYRQERAPGAA